MIVYKKANGRASDLRFVAADYVLAPGEAVYAGDTLPAIDTLHDQSVADADARDKSNASIIAEMNAADAKIIRALLDGDTTRIEAHKAAQSVRRSRIKK